MVAQFSTGILAHFSISIYTYDASRKEEDKLRKVVSEETAFKKEVNSSSPLQYSLEKGVTLSTFSPDSLSQPKDTTNINIEQ